MLTQVDCNFLGEWTPKKARELELSSRGKIFNRSRGHILAQVEMTSVQLVQASLTFRSPSHNFYHLHDDH